MYGESYKSNLENMGRYNVEELATLLNMNRLSRIHLGGKHISLNAKFKLAYKIVETGFFLLGTPWFTQLSSQIVQRLQEPTRVRSKYVLLLSSFEPSKLLCADPHALAETAQLFQIGVLLVETALDKTRMPAKKDTRGPELEIIRLLPEVEQKMGTEYYQGNGILFALSQPIFILS